METQIRTQTINPRRPPHFCHEKLTPFPRNNQKQSPGHFTSENSPTDTPPNIYCVKNYPFPEKFPPNASWFMGPLSYINFYLYFNLLIADCYSYIEFFMVRVIFFRYLKLASSLIAFLFLRKIWQKEKGSKSWNNTNDTSWYILVTFLSWCEMCEFFYRLTCRMQIC